LKFTCDDREIEGDFLFGAISNSMSVGGIVKFDDSVVKLNDGLFEVLLIRNPDNVLKLQPLLDGLLKKDLNREGMEFFHTNKITVTGGDDVSWTLDGEFAEGAPSIEIINIHNAINFIIP
jgi:diacylglycerol kinase family enzyme